MGDTGVEMSQEDAKNLVVLETDHLEIEELAGSLDKLLCSQDNNIQEGVPCNVPASDEHDIGHSDWERMCSDMKAKICSGSAANGQKSLIKSATFPYSKKLLSSLPSIDGIPDAKLNDEISTRAENCACTRAMSLPTPVKLVSAMKGGREQQGTPREMKLQVKWAPDVYDPPATSLSHSVRSHNQRPRTKKDHSKHRHNKGKSSGGSTNEKRHHSSRKSIVNSGSISLRLQGHCDIVPPDGFGQTSVGVMCSQVSVRGSGWLLKGKSSIEVVSSQESVGGSFLGSASGADVVSALDSKCGANFYRSSLAKMHLSITEAL